MNKGISKIISDFKSKSVPIMAVEKALGFSNGMIGKAAKGKYIMSTQKINTLLDYYGTHYPDSKNEVAKMLEPAPIPEYKEGRLYRFENGKFVETIPTTTVLFSNPKEPAEEWEKAGLVNLDKDKYPTVLPGIKEWKETGKFTPTLPLNKEDERPRIGFDNICPISKEQCDDETCTPGAECNVSGSSIQKNYIPDETKSVISGVSKKGISSANIIPPIPVQEKGEDKFDFAARKNDWKRKYGNH